MIPFKDYELNKMLVIRRQKTEDYLESFSNDEIMANDLNILADNCYQKFYLEPISIEEEDLSKRDVKQRKIKHLCDPFWKKDTGQEYLLLDGYSMSFVFPFTGEADLFQCRASAFSLSEYPNIEIAKGSITIHYEVLLNEMETNDDKNKLIMRLKSDLKSINIGISYVNADVEKFNQTLKESALSMLQARKQKIENYYSVSKLFEIPVSKSVFASDHIEVPRKIRPIKKEYKSEPNYFISDSEYTDILLTIKHNGCTYERTPTSLKSLKEEDIRNLLLASLNGVYLGNAMGEAFRNKGKTDICIECDNRAAFVAECKMWKGQSKISEALEQLDGYLTWRDCKTALIYFVRNKNFLTVLETAKQTLKKHQYIRQVRDIDRNEFDCQYISQTNLGQVIRIRVLLFNLFPN